MSMLEARRLTCGYGDRTVVESLSLSANAGEVLVLLGSNGAGKTTLIRALARLLRPSGGTVLLQGHDIWGYSAQQVAQQVALMPQSESRDCPLSVQQSVRLGRAPHRGWLLPLSEDDEQAVQRAILDTGLSTLSERTITELSGGEWRRMIFARALAQEASVLLLDEPTSGLDLKYQHELLRLLRHLAATRGLSVVVTLHDLNLAALYGDRLAVISERRLFAEGVPNEVLTAAMIDQVFGIPATVLPHPVYGTPMIVPLISGEAEPISNWQGCR
jgi:iron complex transport system ATP-binding protein